ncbi:phenylalanine--tRNA ligase subunit alpha [Mycoplasmopsis ciconiae]|uniref:phenylalanine--tRNA ligase n=1 Tax=Mycoplasmopsis ciconiae TaxID=561067 RepID=A0ABU7MMT2_9BACT|nr:phenylalanine--tRNA ligase subunit alpha [Mycoplasmopsis ciconiae]
MKLSLDLINSLEDLKQIKSKLYAADSEFTLLQQEIKKAPVQEKKQLGQKLASLKNEYENFFKEANLKLDNLRIQHKINSEFVDISEPVYFSGSLHPITLIENRLKDWFIQHGYYQEYAGEIESDLYNFEKLNIAKEHPARAMQDSLYLNATTLLRTHNTGITAIELEKNANKEFSTFAIGKVYRNDEDDATHSHQFTQVDFVSVGKVSFSNLIWTLKSLLSYVFEKELEIRLRPSYFPFTEPSVEVDIFYNNRWIEVLGAGMLHPNVFKFAGFSDDKLNGFAAGIGIERLAMIKYNVTDIRDFYRNDLRVLGEFKYEK